MKTVLLLLAAAATNPVEELCADRWPDDQWKKLGCLMGQGIAAGNHRELLATYQDDELARSVLLTCQKRFAPDYVAVQGCSIEAADELVKEMTTAPSP